MTISFDHASNRYRLLDDYPSEPYTDVYWIKFVNIDDARVAKKKMDNRSFFGKNLHVCYAPEYESLQDTREKLRKRMEVIAKKTRGVRPLCLWVIMLLLTHVVMVRAIEGTIARSVEVHDQHFESSGIFLIYFNPGVY